MMNNQRVITYTGAESGRKVLPVPFLSPFRKYREAMAAFLPEPGRREDLEEIAGIISPFQRAEALAEYLFESEQPGNEMLKIVSMASTGEAAAIRLLYSALFAITPMEMIVADLVEFSSLRRIMGRIVDNEKRGIKLEERDEWFKKKVIMISLSRQLPGSGTPEDGNLWEYWPRQVRRALSDPDPKWNNAVKERAKIELEALDRRLKKIIASIHPDNHGKTLLHLKSRLDEIEWRSQVMEADMTEESEVLFIRRKLGERWKLVEAEIGRVEWGDILMSMFNQQSVKMHSQPDLRTGTSLAGAINSHPELGRGGMESNFMGSLVMFVEHAGDGVMEFMVPRGKRLPSLTELNGMEVEEEMLTADLREIPSDLFINADETPCEVDWDVATGGYSVSYRSLVLSNVDNETFLINILNNPKAAMKPGVVSLISIKCRSSRVLSIICNTRSLYTGAQNRDVPLNLIMNPARIPVNSLRKFIHVRYIDRVTLQKLARSRGKIRDEVRREIEHYLASR